MVSISLRQIFYAFVVTLLILPSPAISAATQEFQYKNDDFSIMLPKGTQIKNNSKEFEIRDSSYWDFFYVPSAEEAKINKQKAPIILEFRVPVSDFHYRYDTEDDKRNFLAHWVIAVFKSLEIPNPPDENSIHKNIVNFKLGKNEFLKFKKNNKKGDAAISAYLLPTHSYLIVAVTDNSAQQDKKIEAILSTLKIINPRTTNNVIFQPISLFDGKVEISIPNNFNPVSENDSIWKNSENKTKKQLPHWNRPKYTFLDKKYNSIIVDCVDSDISFNEYPRLIRKFIKEKSSQPSTIHDIRKFNRNSREFILTRAITHMSDKTITYDFILATMLGKKRFEVLIFLNETDYRNWESIAQKIIDSVKLKD